MAFFSSLIVVISISVALLVIDFWTGFIALSCLAAFYAFIIYNQRQVLRSRSKIVSESNSGRIKLVQECLGSIRDVIIDKSQPNYLSNYFLQDRKQRSSQASITVSLAYPRYAFDGLILVFASIYISHQVVLQSKDIVLVINSLSIYFVAFQKLLPAFQQCFSGLSSFDSTHADLKNVSDSLARNNQENKSIKIITEKKSTNSLLSIDSFRILNLTYAHSPATKSLYFDDIEFLRGDFVGITGKSGSGKSTLMDLLMCLIEPKSGSINVTPTNPNDKLNLPNDKLLWFDKIAHVSQRSYLLDRSILENITSSASLANVDVDRFYNVCKICRLSDLINDLPEGESTILGENANRISGGQRQRISLAKALYKEPDILFLDEATNALDPQNEASILSDIKSLYKDKIVVMITHNHNSLKYCNKFIRL